MHNNDSDSLSTSSLIYIVMMYCTYRLGEKKISFFSTFSLFRYLNATFGKLKCDPLICARWMF